MIFLVVAVLCSVAVSVLLKILRQQHIDIRQTILAGYPVAFLLTWGLFEPQTADIATLPVAAWAIVMALGILLPLVFILLGRAIGTVGIIATDAAQRLSLLIPIIAAFVLFGETVTFQRMIGIGIGFLALAALAYRRPHSPMFQSDAKAAPVTPAQGEDATQTSSISSKLPTVFWLTSVWLGYGVIDILFKQVAKQGSAFSLILFLSFGIAGLLLFGYLLRCRVRWQSRALVAGVLLGLLNIGNIYAYIKAHQLLSDAPSIVFTGMNVGVIALATVIGVVIFSERLRKINIVGLILAICCVTVLFWA